MRERDRVQRATEIETQQLKRSLAKALEDASEVIALRAALAEKTSARISLLHANKQLKQSHVIAVDEARIERIRAAGWRKKYKMAHECLSTTAATVSLFRAFEAKEREEEGIEELAALQALGKLMKDRNADALPDSNTVFGNQICGRVKRKVVVDTIGMPNVENPSSGSQEAS